MSDRSDDITSFNNPELDSLITKVTFDRRSFIASSIATGFALSAGPAVRSPAATCRPILPPRKKPASTPRCW